MAVLETVDKAPSAPTAKARRRIDAVDWFRGLAVVLMIQTHLYDAWTSPAGKATAAYAWTRYLGGLPSRLFLLLVGVSMAIKFEAQIARKVPRATMVWGGIKRGLEIVVLAYLFRIQEYILGGGTHWQDLCRVDILNCIGASMVFTAVIAAPWRNRSNSAKKCDRPSASESCTRIDAPTCRSDTRRRAQRTGAPMRASTALRATARRNVLFPDMLEPLITAKCTLFPSSKSL